MKEREPKLMEACPPNCYAKVVEAVSTTQYTNTQGKLDTIIGNQVKIDGSVRTVAEAIIKFASVKEQFEEHKKDAREEFNEVFTRLRKVESKMAWYGGGLSAIVAVFEILRWFHVI